MEYAAFTELKTPHLLLRKLKREDALDFYQFAGSETVTRYMLWKPHKDISESVVSIEKSLIRYKEGKYYRWGIALKETDELIGIIDLLGFDEERNICSFAYMIAEDFWGKGYGTEALKTVLDFAFRQLNVAAVEADHFADNAASGTVMRKAGMQYVGTESDKYEKNGISHDALRYRITLEMWKQQNS